MNSLDDILAGARACTICAEYLPLGPRPVLRAQVTSRLVIIGQAPDTRVHEIGVPWDDPSGARLRDWMGVSSKIFYDHRRIAIVPMGFCYPGRRDKGGDLPPRPECAPAWHPQILAALPERSLTLLVGAYAQARYLPRPKRPVTERVREFRKWLPGFFPLPHPSWRSTNWLKKNPWFEAGVLPDLRSVVEKVLADA